jgi:TonB-linked SusC/RagA family outer membrane protein
VKRLFIILLLILTLIFAWESHAQNESQNFTVYGKISDETGEPLPGATVTVKGTTIGVITGVNGEYNLQVDAGSHTLVFSFLGMESQEFTIDRDQEINVILKESTAAIDEVVITGYQEVDKRTFTGSVGRLDSSQLQQIGVPDVSRMLEGTVAGVAVENVSGTFGSKVKIRIRGNSSISGNQEPLWVVDGVVLEDPVDVNPNQLYSGDPATILSSAISGLNPNDIEEIQILKDASATAMYGTQAVNGVIVVTTKKGKKGDLSVHYDGSFTVIFKPSIEDFHVMNSKERMEFSEELYAKNLMDFSDLNKTYGAYGKLLADLAAKDTSQGNTWLDDFDENVRKYKLNNTDWFDVLFKNSLVQEHSLSISSGGEKSQYYFSGSYYHDNGQTIGQHAKRYTANMRANFDIFKRLSVETILTGSVRDQLIFGAAESTSDNGITTREYDVNPYNYAINTSRAMRPYDDSGELEYYKKDYAPFNILNEIENNYINVDATDLKMQANVHFRFTRSLSYLGIFSARYSTSALEHTITENSNYAESFRAAYNDEIRRLNDRLYNDPDDDDQNPISVLETGGILIPENTTANFYTVRNSLNWKPSLQGIHYFDILAGVEFRQKAYSITEFTGWGFDVSKGRGAYPDYRAIKRDLLTDGDAYYSSDIYQYSDVAFYSNIAYSYKTLYNVSFSIRSDGSNRLGKSQRFRFLPTWVIGASWNVHDQKFMQGNRIITFLKLRSSYGLRGNVGGLGSPSLLAYYRSTTRFEGSDNERVIDIISPENSDLQWEKEYMFNAAIEMGFFNLHMVSVEYYNRYNFDLIGDIEVPRESGFETKFVNYADMKNEGIEVTLNTSNISKPNFIWNTVFTLGYNKNTILNAYFNPTVNELTVPEGAAQEGKPVNGLYSFRFAGLNNQGVPQFYDENGEITLIIDQFSRDLGMINYEGPRDPVATGGLTNIFGYRNFELSFLFTFSYGNKIILRPIFAYYYDDVQALDKDLIYRWQVPGDEEYTTIPVVLDKEQRDRLTSNNQNPATFYNRSDIRVADGSYIRLRNISLTYNFPGKVLQKVKIKGAQLQLQGQNLLLWADPKLNGQDPEAISTGISIPAPKSVSLGIKLNF